MTEMLHYRVVILGAGLCGLSAASYLEEVGRTDYLILERDARAGGLARTTVIDGFAFDHAIHILYSHHPYATDLIRNTLLNGNLQSQARRSRRSASFSAVPSLRRIAAVRIAYSGIRLKGASRPCRAR